jgi:hypothetical protein
MPRHPDRRTIMSKKHAEPVQATSVQCFSWLTRVAEVAMSEGTDMSNAIGLDQIADVLRMETIKQDLTTAINEATILLVNLKARAEAVSQMAKDLM